MAHLSALWGPPCPFEVYGWCPRPECNRILNGECAWFNEVHAARTSNSTSDAPSAANGGKEIK